LFHGVDVLERALFLAKSGPDREQTARLCGRLDRRRAVQEQIKIEGGDLEAGVTA
jgi:hypothetical protein